MNITVQTAQTDPVTGDIQANTNRIINRIQTAKENGVDVIVFPEMAITGYCILDLVENDALINANIEALDEIQNATSDIAAVIGFVNREGDDRRNNAVVLQDGETKGITTKALLPTYRYFDDDRYFEPGKKPTEPIPITVNGEEINLGVSICEDMWTDNYVRNPIKELAALNADIIININASPFEPSKREARDAVIRKHIKQTGLPFVYTNTVGAADVHNNIIVFDGDSAVYDNTGTPIARAPQFEPGTATATITLNKTQSFTDKTTVTSPQREKELYDALVTGLRGYINKTGFETIIEPVSGGIDSSVGLAICVEAVGAENVTAFNLPSKVNSNTTKNIASKLANNFDVQYESIPVQTIYDEFLDIYEEHYEDVTVGTARENVYARIRAVLMMLASNNASDSPAMLVSNGNETEMALGYVTLYGDMASGLSLLGDLSKNDVYDLGRYINERHGEAMIPEKTFEIEPTAELSMDQSDPFDYQTISPIVDALLENREDPAEIAARFETRSLNTDAYGIDKNGNTVYERYDAEAFADIVYDTYDRLVNSTFKRVQSAPIIAVSERAFGTDFREPIINAWNSER